MQHMQSRRNRYKELKYSLREKLYTKSDAETYLPFY